MYSDKLAHRPDLLQTLAQTPEEADMFHSVVKDFCEVHGITHHERIVEINRRVSALIFAGLRSREKLTLGLEANRAEDGRIAHNKELLRGVARQRLRRIGDRRG